MPDTTLGAIRTGAIAANGVEAKLFERGISLKSALGETPVHFGFPSLLRPTIQTGGGQGPAFRSGLSAIHSPGQHDQLKAIVDDLLNDRLSLSARGQAAPSAALRIAESTPGAESTSFSLMIDGALAHRQLYDVTIRTDDGANRVVAPNALYYRDDWTNFGIAHITDMHVARRIDRFRGLLRDAGLDDAATRVINWNDRFRGFVKYANSLHGEGKLDLILATGDLYDFIHEDDDDPAGGGNAAFLRDLIIGAAPGPDFPSVEPLRVPIFGVPGNHDYRKHPYRLIFDIHVGVDIGDRIHNHSGYLISGAEAAELANRLEGNSGTDVKNCSRDEANAMAEVDRDNLAFRNNLGQIGSYVIALGPHKVAMLDTEWDSGIVSDLVDAASYKLGWASEDQEAFVGGSPNSHGIEDTEYDLTINALTQASPNALFIVGLHAPLFNPRAYPYYLRESQRPSQGDQPEAYVAYESATNRDKVRADHPTWFRPPNDHRSITFFKRGTPDDGLEHGVARGRGPDLLRDLATGAGARPADLVLAGHTHLYNEFIVRPADNGEITYYMDFYTQNPGSYYPTRFMSTWKNGEKPSTEVTYVDVVPGSSPEYRPWSAPPGLMHPNVVHVPPYANPLNEAVDKRQWWSDHRPLVLQTGALGPIENNQVSFSGFRMISVENNVISAIHFISSERLERAGFQLPWDEAIRIDAPRVFPFVGRSEQYGMPAAAGDPGACVLNSGTSDIIYRDVNNNILELWRDTANQSGGGNLTGVAAAPVATGSPRPYFNTATDQIIVPYRATDGVVHSVYSIPGGTGHDNLGGFANAPNCEGNPVGFYTPPSDEHHVIYRAGDGHLHSLYWQGGNPVAHEDLFWQDFPHAAGDPSPYFGGGVNIIAYRGTDGEIHTVYWAGVDATGHDSLSAVAGMPNSAGDPVAYHCTRPEGEVHQVTYRALDGQVIELWWVGAAVVQGWSLTAASGAPPAAGDPTAYYNPEAEKKYVVYVSADGHVHELRWTPGGGAPDHLDVTAEMNAPLATGRPAAFYQSASNTRHVIYRSIEGNVIEMVMGYRRAMPGGTTHPTFGGGTVVIH